VGKNLQLQLVSAAQQVVARLVRDPHSIAVEANPRRCRADRICADELAVGVVEFAYSIGSGVRDPDTATVEYDSNRCGFRRVRDDDRAVTRELSDTVSP
jgi:hypothetical protein